MTQDFAVTPGRRALLLGSGAACAAVLAGCTSASSSTASGGSGTTSSGGTTTTKPASGNVLASTADVPTGGGTIVTGKNIVITQPEAGTFKAFTAVCTHAQCIVDKVANGTIDCPCHGSEFSATDGSVVRGPAATPLAPVEIKVNGTSIVQA
jgi:Rieske Fe-S protein